MFSLPKFRIRHGYNRIRAPKDYICIYTLIQGVPQLYANVQL